jgi:hypothetical protein
MTVYKTKLFARFSTIERISDARLIDAVERAADGLVDADLGGGLIKQRVAREGQGRRGGYRTLIAFRSELFAVFLYGFAKKDRENLDTKELRLVRQLAEVWLNSDADMLEGAIEDGRLVEVRK